MINFNNKITPSFKGYSNIISSDIKNGDTRLIFMSMELDNKNGYNDLADLKHIRNLAGVTDDTNTLTIIYSKDSKKAESFIVDGKPLYSGDELYDLWSKYHKLPLYKFDEKIALKTYTLLASITGRIMQGIPSYNNEGFNKVILDSFKTLSEMLNCDTQSLLVFIQDCLLNGTPLEQNATSLNKILVSNMKKFLKL